MTHVRSWLGDKLIADTETGFRDDAACQRVMQTAIDAGFFVRVPVSKLVGDVPVILPDVETERRKAA